MVWEVFSHGSLVLLLLGLWWGRHVMVGARDGTKALILSLGHRKQRKRKGWVPLSL